MTEAVSLRLALARDGTPGNEIRDLGQRWISPIFIVNVQPGVSVILGLLGSQFVPISNITKLLQLVGTSSKFVIHV